jgi:hypothetical protein
MTSRKNLPVNDQDRSDHLEKYMDRFSRNLKIKDEQMKEEIIHTIRSRLKGLAEPGDDLNELIGKLGDPSKLGRELSNPENWVVEIGTPLSPKVPINPFFSQKGRIFLGGIFILGLIMSFAILVTLGDPGWIVAGILIIFFAIWIILSALLNSYLGYFSTLREMKKEGIRLEGISYSLLKKHTIVYLCIILSILVLLAFVPVLLDSTHGIISLPLSLSTSVAVIVSSAIVMREGKKVL